MDEEIERLVVSVRADTQAFDKDVVTMRASLDGPFAAGVDRAGRALENSLLRAVRTGKLGFDDLRNVALSALAEIAAAAVKSGLDSLLGGGGNSGGGLTGGLISLVGSLFGGAPGRATGGPVSPYRPYLVGERGPELFVPTSSGSIAQATQAGGRDVRVAITVNASGDAAPQALQQSSRQVARAVRAALTNLD